jgi:hypothetical protein
VGLSIKLQEHKALWEANANENLRVEHEEDDEFSPRTIIICKECYNVIEDEIRWAHVVACRSSHLTFTLKS